MRTEDTSRQAEAVEDARTALRTALQDLAHLAGHQARRKRPEPSEVLGAASRVRRAEETLDIAEFDLATSRGEDA